MDITTTLGLTGFARRAVIARFQPLDQVGPIRDFEQWHREQATVDVAIKADPAIRLGAEIEEAMAAVIDRALGRGVSGADALAEAVVTDPKVLAVIERPGAAAVILRQFVGMMITHEEGEAERWT